LFQLIFCNPLHFYLSKLPLGWVYTPVISATQEAESGGFKFQASLEKVSKILSQKQNTKQNKGKSVAQVVKCLPSKREVLGSIQNKTKQNWNLFVFVS
jgi:hypothetical protein